MKFLASIILLFVSFHSSASHIAAGEMYYDYLGNNDYEVKLLLYRECSGAAFDNPLSFTIFDQANNVIQQELMSLDAANVQSVDYTTITNQSCLSQFSGACLEFYTYSTVVNLPPIIGGYTLSYQRCCLTHQIMNVEAPSEWGYTWTCSIPGIETGQFENSSARFVGHSLFLACTNEVTDFNHVAIDPDGDSLVYNIITPNSFNSMGFLVVDPNPESPPPYVLLPYALGFTSQSPIGSGGTLLIDSNTGLMTVQPVLVGQFAIGVKVDEYKSDSLINTTYRNLNMQVAAGTLGIDNTLLNNEFTIFPNPASNEVTINSNTEHSLSVFTAEGKRVIGLDITNDKNYNLDISYLESGVYYFKFHSELGTVVKPVYK